MLGKIFTALIFVVFLVTVNVINHKVKQSDLARAHAAQALEIQEARRLELEERMQSMQQEQERQRQIEEHQVHRDEIDCLATNIYHEARGEPITGQEAVAHVTVNRMHSSRFPSTACEVVHQARRNSRGEPRLHRCQFSWYCDGVDREVSDTRAYRRARQIAETVYVNRVLNEHGQDPTQGSTHYHARRVNPHWSRHANYQEVAMVGEHIFYRPTYN